MAGFLDLVLSAEVGVVYEERERTAEQISYGPRQMRVSQGKLKAFRVAGLRKVLIPRAELLSLLEPTKRPDSQTPAA